MNIWKTHIRSAAACLFILIVLIPLPELIACEPEELPPPPEIIWPLDNEESVPLDTAIIFKDFKSINKNPPKLEIVLTDGAGKSVSYKSKRYQTRRSVYNYEAGFVFIKPDKNLKPEEKYKFTLKAVEGYAGPINQRVEFTTGNDQTMVTAPEKIEVSYYLSEPGYYLSNCQTSAWDKATSMVYVDSKVEGYPVILIMDSNLLKDIAFFHSSLNKRDLAVLFLPNEKGLKQCFNLSAYSVNGDKFYSDKLCSPGRCVKGEYLSKERAEEEYKKHGAFGFSMIEFPSPGAELHNYCTLYPPLCRAYWDSVPDNNCREPD